MTSPQPALNPFGTVGEPSFSTTNPPPPAVAPAPATTGPAAGPASPGQPSQGGYTPSQILAPLQDEFDRANKNVADIWAAIQKQLTIVEAARADPTATLPGGRFATESASLDRLYATYAQALQRVETASTARATALNTAIHNGTIDPTAAQEAQARATQETEAGNLAAAQAKVLTDGADTQKAYVAAQAGATAQQGLLYSAQADLTRAQASKIPADIAVAQAQAAALKAQADQTNLLLPGLKAKQDADTTLTLAQAGLTDSNSDLAKANTAKVNADAEYQRSVTRTLLPSQVGLNQAQATNQLAGAAGTLATIGQNTLGPALYGLQDQVNAIRSIQEYAFGLGGSGTAEERTQQANDLLQQYITAKIAGTTPYQANVTAADAGLQAFGTQASLANAAQSAAASRANAYSSLAGNVLGTLAQMNANAPAGSTALAGAFNDVMNQIMQREQAPQFAAPAMPQAPPLPALLQRLAPPGVPAPAPGPGPGPGPGAGLPSPPAGQVPGIVPPRTAPAPAAPAAPAAPVAPASPAAPVTINIGGQGQGQTPDWYSAWQQRQAADTAQQRAASGLPNMLQQYQPASMDYLHQLWGNELSSGAVQSPYAAMGAR